MSDATEQSGRSQWNLVLYDGSTPDRVFPIDRDIVTIGRELYHDIALDELYISKNHAQITRQGEQLVIEDLDSVNGTAVNDELILEPCPLQAGDIVTLGPFTFKVERSTADGPQAQTQTWSLPVPKIQPKPGRVLLLLGIIGALLVIIALMALGLGWWRRAERLSAEVEATSTATMVPRAPGIVVNRAPARDSQVKVNQSVLMQATASDPSGVTRMELWVNDRQVDEVVSQLAQNVPSMTAAFQWAAETPGSYLIEIRAYNQAGLVSTVAVTTLTAFGNQPILTPAPTDIPSPTPTMTSIPPSPTPVPTATATSTLVLLPTPRLALLVVNVPVLNVRSGPGGQYSTLGRLEQGDGVEIVGQTVTPAGQWWQIRFDSEAGNLGWLSADASFTTAINTDVVPAVSIQPLPSPVLIDTPTPTPTATATVPVIRASVGKTLLIVSNRSLANIPARLTLSGGKSVGGGKEIDVAANSQVEIVLEPDFYRALWSAPVRSFTRGSDFTAVPGKVMIMWIVPENGLTDTEVYDELRVGGGLEPTPTPAQVSTATPVPVISGYRAPIGKALLVVANQSMANVFAVVTVSGGSFGGGQQIKLDANSEIPLELLPGAYRTIWSTPGFTAGHEFRVTAGEVILGWIIPENGQVFMQFPGQSPRQINN